MKPLISLVVAAVMALSGMTVAFAEETTGAAQTVADVNQDNDNLSTGGQSVSDDTTEDTTENVQPTTIPNTDMENPEENTDSEDTVKKGVYFSSNGKYKLYIYDDGKLAYADIIKYVGKDKFSKNTVITTVDGYKIRQIRSKAFSNLKTLRSVRFPGAYFSAKNKSTVLKNAFYNCKNMTSFSTSSFVTLNSKSVGYVNGKRSGKFTTLTFNDVTKTQKEVSSKLNYTKVNSINAVYNVSKNNTNNRKAKLVDFLNGYTFSVKLAGKTVKGWKSTNPKAISISDKGQAVVLAKGTTTLYVKIGKLKVKRVFTVTTNPYLSVKGKKVTSVTVKNGKTVSVTVKGKAADVDNVFTNTDYASFTSLENSDVLKIKGTRRGKTTVKVKVNGLVLKLKVTVEKNPITDDKMARIAASIGHQSQYVYGDSGVMCSAYAFCYAYYQVKGKKITPGSVWCPGGCTWIGGSYNHYGSTASMLKAIKTSLDKNQACVGLLSIGNSATHYVTFYDYEDDGKDLSDFKILDPWDGNLTTGYFYGYSYGYHVVTIDT